MDPITIAAMVGLVYAGKTLSKQEKEKAEIIDNSESPDAPLPDPPQTARDRVEQGLTAPFFGNNINNNPNDQNASAITNEFTGLFTAENPVSGVNPSGAKDIVGTFADIAPGRSPFGQPAISLSDRLNQNVSNKMNNLSPVQKEYVGPGIGLPANVPSYGGFQQLYRVMPNNVGAYKLTTLPGRSGPANGTVIGQKGGSEIGQLTHFKPTTNIEYARRPPVKNRAQGQGGEVTGNAIRQKYTNTERPTNRSETTLRQDGLEYAPASSYVSKPTAQDHPTRNKGDYNVTRVNDVAAPGIHSFHGGYTNAPTDIRLANNRGKMERAGNPGMMNVRGSPLQTAGLLTKARDNRESSYFGITGTTGSNNQNYTRSEYYDLNVFKGIENPRATNSGMNLVKA